MAIKDKILFVNKNKCDLQLIDLKNNDVLEEWGID